VSAMWSGPLISASTSCCEAWSRDRPDLRADLMPAAQVEDLIKRYRKTAASQVTSAAALP
jgi:hypothetical protein